MEMVSDEQSSFSPGRYEFTGLQSVSWGQSAVKACLDEVAQLESRYVMVVTSPSLRKASSVPDEIVSSLGDKAGKIFDNLLPHTPVSQVADLSRRLSDTGADLVISLGGGTPIDTVKIALAMLQAGETDPLAIIDKAPSRNLPPVRQIACPTTLSGAEFSDLAGLTDTETRIKHSIAGYGLGPKSVILDPELSLHTPLDLWLSTGMRAVDHAVETICSIEATPFTDALALEALGQLASALRTTKCDPANLDARSTAQQAVWMASTGLNRTPYGASHGISHQLGAVTGVPHGICSCVLLPAVLEWNREETKSAQSKIANVLEAETAAQGIRVLLRDLELPDCLSKVGVTRKQISEIAEGSARNRWVKTNPRPFEKTADIEVLLETAF